jgi:hypothetical protein
MRYKAVLKTIHKTSSWLLVVLGVVHTALTPTFYGRLSPGALWFAGAGLAMIFVGFLNIIFARTAGHDRMPRILCYIANLITAAFGVLIVLVDNEPQVIFGMILISLMTVTAFLLRK